jgi:outer membrane protein insertion porin family
MIQRRCFPPVLGFLLVSSTFATERVTSVEVPGSNLQVKLATQVGRQFDAETIAKDVRYLWSLGRFEDIRVETAEREDGVAVVFRTQVIPIRMLREIRIEPNTFGLQIKIPQDTPMTTLRADATALEAQRQLIQLGYQNARIHYQMKPAPMSQVDLRLTVDLGDAIRVKQVRLEGAAGPALPDDAAALAGLRALRSRRLLFWRLLPSYSQEAVDSDVARIRSSYLAKGYLDADVRPGAVDIHGNDAKVTIIVDPGPQHGIDPDLCRSLFTERREAQREGILDFSATLDADRGLTVDRGLPYRVGRIEFTGNHRYHDLTLRRDLSVQEGARFDERLLRKSIANLNRTGMFESIDAKHVVVEPNEKTGLADVTLRLTERKRGRWRLSGPVGPAALAGPLEASLSSRLPPWGRGLLELSTYCVSVSMLAFAHPLLPILNAPKRFVPILALERPYMPGEGWKSGFLIAPQLGWKNSALAYGATQLQQRLLPLVSVDRSLDPDLNITVNRTAGEAVLSCEPPRPRLGLFRATASVALRLMGSLAAL